MPDQNNPLFAYLMAHPLTANTGPVSSIGEGAARVGSGALGGMNNMLMAQLLAPQKKPAVAPTPMSFPQGGGGYGPYGMYGQAGIPDGQ